MEVDFGVMETVFTALIATGGGGMKYIHGATKSFIKELKDDHEKTIEKLEENIKDKDGEHKEKIKEITEMLNKRIDTIKGDHKHYVEKTDNKLGEISENITKILVIVGDRDAS